MAKISVFDQDFDDALSNRTDPIVYLPKVAAPFTTVVKRALMTDLANDLLPRFGVDRVMTQTTQEVQGESGPAGERVFKPINDQHDAVRIVVGSIGLLNNSSGQQIFLDPSGFVEISFYGTGLNLLHFTDTNARSLTVTTDGVLGATITLSSATNSTVLAGRNYSMSCVSNIVSGLALGFHTVKLIVVNQIIFSGYEVLNTNSTLQLLPGRSYLGGKRLYKAAASTDAYNSNFESGTLGTKGGHVVVYQKSDGTVAKAVTPTNASQANLGSTNHTNESLIRSYQWREFGAGLSGDFSLAIGNFGSAAFTLDDGTTTLTAGANASTNAVQPEGLSALNVSGTFITLTFVGTGLDIIGQSDGATRQFDSVQIDGGTSIGALSMAASALTSVYKVVSGLPYGSHTVKFSQTSATFSPAIYQFVIYGPAKPAIPSGAIELADYYLLGDYAIGSSSAINFVSSGIIRKVSTREQFYSGTWTIDVPPPNPSAFDNGYQVYTSTSTSFVEHTFLGFGCEFRGYVSNGHAVNMTFLMNGLAFDAGSNIGSTSSLLATGVTGLSLSAAGVLTGTAAGSGEIIVRIFSSTFAIRKLRATQNGATISPGFISIDTITPVHSPKINQPGDLQNTLPIGSCAIGDSRKFSSTLVKTLANWVQAIGVSVTPSTTSTVAIPMHDMSVTIKTSGNPIQISYAATVRNNTSAGNNVALRVYVDGIAVGTQKYMDAPVAGYSITVSDCFIIPCSAGVHKVDLYWYTNAGTAASPSNQRSLTVTEI